MPNKETGGHSRPHQRRIPGLALKTPRTETRFSANCAFRCSSPGKQGGTETCMFSNPSRPLFSLESTFAPTPTGYFAISLVFCEAIRSRQHQYAPSLLLPGISLNSSRCLLFFDFCLSTSIPVLTTSTYVVAWPQGDQFLGGGM